MLKLFGLSEILEKLPPLCNSAEIAGAVSKEAADKTGLVEGTPVAGGMFDIDACAIAVDAAREDRVCMIAGTWSINEYIQKEPVLDGKVALNSLFCLPEYYLIEESSPTSAGNYEWFINTMLTEMKEEAKKSGVSVYQQIDKLISSVPASEFCPVFTPFLMGSNVHPNAKSSLVGMSNYHERKHILKAIYEGIAFSHKYHFEKLEASRKEKASCIRLAGGVAKSEVWSQMFADILNYPVEVVDINETGALGSAMAAAVAVGEYGDFSEAANAMSRTKARYLPNDQNHKAYSKRYALYKKVLLSLDGIWIDVQTLIDSGKVQP